MDLLVEILDFTTSLFGESVAIFFDKKIKSGKIKALLSILAILISLVCVIGIIALIVVIVMNFK